MSPHAVHCIKPLRITRSSAQNLFCIPPTPRCLFGVSPDGFSPAEASPNAGSGIYRDQPAKQHAWNPQVCRMGWDVYTRLCDHMNTLHAYRRFRTVFAALRSHT